MNRKVTFSSFASVVAAAGVLTGSMTAVAGTHAFPSFNQVVFNDPTIPGLDPETVPLMGAPAGTYYSYTVSVQWSALAGDPYSAEAVWAMTENANINSSIRAYADPGGAPNGVFNGLPVTLQWNHFLTLPYFGGDPLHFHMAQQFSGSSANWDNITITLTDSVPLPAAPASTPTVIGSSLTAPLAAGQVLWLQFDYSGGALNIDTLGTTIGGNPLQNDTEIALFSVTGGLIINEDDIDYAGGNFLSAISLPDGAIPPGTYWLAVSGFNTVYDQHTPFFASSSSGYSGTVQVNGISIPEPACIGLIGLGGLMFLQRRNRR